MFAPVSSDVCCFFQVHPNCFVMKSSSKNHFSWGCHSKEDGRGSERPGTDAAGPCELLSMRLLSLAWPSHRDFSSHSAARIMASYADGIIEMIYGRGKSTKNCPSVDVQLEQFQMALQRFQAIGRRYYSLIIGLEANHLLPMTCTTDWNNAMMKVTLRLAMFSAHPWGAIGHRDRARFHRWDKLHGCRATSVNGKGSMIQVQGRVFQMYDIDEAYHL